MKPACIIICLLASFLGFAQEEVKYSYDDHPKLTWEDFKAKPQLNSQFHANTNSGFSYSWSYSAQNGEINFEYEVYSTFYPNNSWVHPNHKSDELLAHEQLHFDISELHARKLRNAMEDYQPGRNIRRDFKNLYKAIETERVAMQHLFDKETAHSQNKMKEAEWQAFVADALKKLNGFNKA